VGRNLAETIRSLDHGGLQGRRRALVGRGQRPDERRPPGVLGGHEQQHREHAHRQPLDLACLLEEALRPWWEELDATPEEVTACWMAIQRARRHADRDEGKPIA
jgi:hypothetical protein